MASTHGDDRFADQSNGEQTAVADPDVVELTVTVPLHVGLSEKNTVGSVQPANEPDAVPAQPVDPSQVIMTLPPAPSEAVRFDGIVASQQGLLTPGSQQSVQLE